MTGWRTSMVLRAYRTSTCRPTPSQSTHSKSKSSSTKRSHKRSSANSSSEWPSYKNSKSLQISNNRSSSPTNNTSKRKPTPLICTLSKIKSTKNWESLIMASLKMTYVRSPTISRIKWTNSTSSANSSESKYQTSRLIKRNSSNSISTYPQSSISSKPQRESSLVINLPVKKTRNLLNWKKEPLDNNSLPKPKIDLHKPKPIPSKRPVPENKTLYKFTPNLLTYPKTPNSPEPINKNPKLFCKPPSKDSANKCQETSRKQS